MIHADLHGDARTRATLAGVCPRVQQALDASVGRLTLRLLARVKRDKLSGQVLNVQSGRLRRSINHRLSRNGTETAGYVGTNVAYGRRHELGFAGTETVREHLRTLTQAWGKRLRQPRIVTVGGHSRRVDYPARSFLRSALQDMAPEVQQALREAVRQGSRR